MPPGVGLSGWGPEGKPAAGFRSRLYARALVLEDARGERLALVALDLPFTSILLQSAVADSLPPAHGIRSDRLILAATHTHAGPGHFQDAQSINAQASWVAGYDPRIVAFLAGRIARAVTHAADRLVPACAAWGDVEIWGHTRNRSYGAFRRNAPERLPWNPPPGLDPAQAAVNPLWTMLRVDRAAPEGGCAAGRTTPVGGFSTFAMHGTGNPGENDLQDADIHGIIASRLEYQTDLLSGRIPAHLPEAVQLVANGAEGDVSPDYPVQSRCDLPALEPVLRPGGPRSSPAWDWVHPNAEAVAACVSVARSYIVAAGDTLARRALALYKRLGADLRGDYTLAVTSKVLWLRRDAVALGVCNRPMVGTSTAAGAEDGPSRFHGFRFLGLIPVGIEEGGRAIRRPPKGCQREKNRILNVAVAHHALPELAPLTVVRIGPVALATVPGEPTTMTGVHIQRAVAESSAVPGREPLTVAVVGHANGFFQYITTDREYSAQTYEGGSTLYGPNQAAVLARELGRLAGTLARAETGSPPVQPDTLIVYPGKAAPVLPQHEGPAEVARRVLSARACGDTLVVRWVDLHPGRIRIDEAPLLRIERHRGAVGAVVVARDGDPDVEVRWLGRRKGDGWLWEVRWRTGSHPEPGPWRVVLQPRLGMPEVIGSWCPLAAGTGAR